MRLQFLTKNRFSKKFYFSQSFDFHVNLQIWLKIVGKRPIFLWKSKLSVKIFDQNVDVDVKFLFSQKNPPTFYPQFYVKISTLKIILKLCPKYWEANTSIEKILFLNARKHHPETASLLASGDLGWVFAWSVHRQGGLLGQFTARVVQ